MYDKHLALAGHLNAACMKINVCNTTVKVNPVFIKVSCERVFSFGIFSDLEYEC